MVSAKIIQNGATRQRERRIAVAMLLLTNAAWGVSFPVMKALGETQKLALPQSSPLFRASSTMTARFLIAAVLMAAFLSKRLRGLTARDAQLGVGLGIFAGLGTALQFVGLEYTLASTSAFLTQLSVLLIPIVTAIWIRRLPTWRVWASCALVMIGMGILCQVDWLNIQLGRGEWLTLTSAFCFTGQIIWLGRPTFRDCDKLRATLIMLITIAVMFLPITLVTGTVGDAIVANSSTAAIVMLVVLALICSVIAFGVMNTYQPKITPTQAGVVYCFEPIFASFYALFMPAWLAVLAGIAYANESVTFHLLVGGALITAANVLIQFEQKKERQ